jgi:hypothetical protein
MTDLPPLFSVRDDALSIGRWHWDVRADRITADAPFATMYGVPPAVAAEGASIETFFGGIHPADLPRVQAAITRAIDTGEAFEEEYRVIDADGCVRWLVAQGRVERDEAGEVVAFPGVSYDIDARKRNELRLAATVEINDRLRAEGDAGDLALAAAEVLGRTLDVSRAGYGTVDPRSETACAVGDVVHQHAGHRTGRLRRVAVPQQRDPARVE